MCFRLTCMASGFYPRHIEMSLQMNGVPVTEEGGVRSTGTIPNWDGTFQLRKSLEIADCVLPYDVHYVCVVKHLKTIKTLPIIKLGKCLNCFSDQMFFLSNQRKCVIHQHEHYWGSHLHYVFKRDWFQTNHSFSFLLKMECVDSFWGLEMGSSWLLSFCSYSPMLSSTVLWKGKQAVESFEFVSFKSPFCCTMQFRILA